MLFFFRTIGHLSLKDGMVGVNIKRPGITILDIAQANTIMTRALNHSLTSSGGVSHSRSTLTSNDTQCQREVTTTEPEPTAGEKLANQVCQTY